MDEKFKFITEKQREQLKRSYELIQKVHQELDIEYEEYLIIKNTLYSLKKGIEYEEKYY